MRRIEGMKTEITIPEFKFIITRYSVKKSNWFKVAKMLEKQGYIKTHYQNSIEVNMKHFINA